MRFDIRYRTSFTYEDLVRESQNELRACPASDDEPGAHQLPRGHLAERQGVLVHRLLGHPGRRVRPAPAPRRPRGGGRGVGRDPPAAAADRRAPPRRAARRRASATSTGSTCSARPTPTGARASRPRPPASASSSATTWSAWCSALHRVTGARLTYAVGATDVGTPVEEVLARGKGVCQDYAHVAVALCRSQGIPARYVSGYLFTRDDRDRRRRRATATWSTCRPTPGSRPPSPASGGWPLDPPTSRRSGVRHVKIGHGRDYDDVQPLRGVFAGSTMPTGRTPRRDPAPAAAAVPAAVAPAQGQHAP